MSHTSVFNRLNERKSVEKTTEPHATVYLRFFLHETAHLVIGKSSATSAEPAVSKAILSPMRFCGFSN
jgi:hypothetical protein